MPSGRRPGRVRAGLAFTVLRSCARFGGPAAAPLERAAATLRARDAVAAEQQAQSAQARLSARVLTLVPIALLGAARRHRPQGARRHRHPGRRRRRAPRRPAQRRRCAVDAPDHRTAAMSAAERAGRLRGSGGGASSRRARRRRRRPPAGGTRPATCAGSTVVNAAAAIGAVVVAIVAVAGRRRDRRRRAGPHGRRRRVRRRGDGASAGTRERRRDRSRRSTRRCRTPSS